ncbi:MAG: phosphomethylpyrimidine kinase [Flavobacteriaceae bacterium]|nr:phosphomethylpyrimidine kinase [Flavobacteriaceae bacterium]MBD11076.1 phosphomethylpyrimidine kinase [Flavobacteriaceae bacterium]|tara:strand:+ start:6441 stop:7910 length:1470 start_codon:yes stop_codon:yes gene_type:complete
MQLTKTNFIQYLHCPESLWLLKNKEEDYPKGEFSLFLEKLIKEGYEVESYAQKLFPNGNKLPSFTTPEQTALALSDNNSHYFQPSFETQKGAYAVIDILKRKGDGSWHIYEVKSSNSIKTDKNHNHIKDACFQKYVMTECGYTISQVSIIHLNKDFVKQGTIEPIELLEIVDITDEVNIIYSSTVNDINAALNFIKKDIDLIQCSCIEKTRSNHCDAFQYFNPQVENHSIYEINRISTKKIEELRELGVLQIEDVPDNFELNEKQQLQVLSNKRKEPIINTNEIQQILNKLNFPLHFIDYETYPAAVPKLDGMSPHEHLTFQVSIHTLLSDSTLKHNEYLSDNLELPENLLKLMKDTTGEAGTFISWYAPFETSRNKEMIKLFPEYESYLQYINDNMFDLETIFHSLYVDYRFLGRTSIKNVLPVLVPNLSYKDLNIQNGTMALDTWGRTILKPEEFEDLGKVRNDLLKYCELDTLGMVEIYEYLIALN